MKEWLESWLSGYGLNYETGGVAYQVFLVLLILSVAYLADWICRTILVRMVKRIVRKTKVTWDDIVFNDRVLSSFCHIIPPVIIYALLPLAFGQLPGFFSFVMRLCMIYIIAVVLKFISVFLNVLYELTNRKEKLRNHSLKGVFQIIQVGVFFVGAIIVVSVLINKSPVHLFAGLGASAAILMLVFKDTIMGLVSGVQLSANDMLRPGDWIAMPKYGADGTVVEVTLNTVKVRNWDNTITTIPPYALVSDSFQNWRGMQESGARRVKRSINIDMTSVCFCTEEMLDGYRGIVLLQSYIEQTEQAVRLYNQEHGIDGKNPANGRHQTNLGVFRAYLEMYLRSLPTVDQNSTLMVRQLQPTEKGIPMELYFFCATTEWARYEKIQSDVFDHVLAVMPEFGLRVFQEPSGADFRLLAQKS